MRLMSGVRTSGALHIGNYWGAVRNWIQLQNEYQCFFGVMDWHGMTSVYKNTQDIMPWNRDIVAELIAWGIDPSKNVLFIQSLVPEILELFMIFANLTPMGWLERVPTWKDSEEDNKMKDTHNLGRFSYPVLQAADIAIFLGSVVPVGQDQIAHLELCRDIVRRFNHLYKAKLPEPKVLLTETPMLPGLDGRKMSKSYDNSLLMTEEEDSLKKKVNMMLTDSHRVRREDPGEPELCTVYFFHKAYTSAEDLNWVVTGCRTAGIGCGECKGKLAENINNLTKKPREIKKELLKNQTQLDSIIAEGCGRARSEAQKTLQIIKKHMKLV